MLNSFKDDYQFEFPEDGTAIVKCSKDYSVIEHIGEDFEVHVPVNRTIKFVALKGTKIEVNAVGTGNYGSLTFTKTVNEETPQGQKLVVDADLQPTMYDRLRADMLRAVSEYADNRGYDKYPEEEDLEFIDDELHDPLTPSEYVEMSEEFLDETQSPVVETEQSEGTIGESEAPQVEQSETTE